MDRRNLRFLAEYSIFRVIVFVLRTLPVRSAFRMADRLAWFVHAVLPKRMTRYNVSRDNLRQAFGANLSEPEVDHLIHGMWQHLCRMICEMIQLPRRLRLYNCGEFLDFWQREECVAALCAGRPVLFLGGHFGNWEISVNTFGHFGFPMGVVARELDNPYLQNWFREFRESTGNSVISKHGAGNELTDILGRGGMASLLCDQDAGRSGVFVDFFGRPASTFKSIGLLALQYDALIVVGGAWRLPPAAQSNSRWVRFNLTTQAILDARDFQDSDGLARLTQQYTSALEDLIRKAPEQYFWVHRRWKTPPGARRKPRPAAA